MSSLLGSCGPGGQLELDGGRCVTRVGLVMAGGGRSEVSGGWQRSPEPRHPDETELRHPGDPGPWDTLDHGAWHPGNAAHEDSTARADTEHGCNREKRLVIRRKMGDTAD